MRILSRQRKNVAAPILVSMCAVALMFGCQTVQLAPHPPAISAIHSYKLLISDRQFAMLYDQAVHSKLKASTTQEEFVARMEAGFDETFRRLCADILAAYESGGIKDGRLYIGPMKYPTIDETIVVELTDRVPVTSDTVIQPGNARRIQLAPEDDLLRFYDID